MGLTIKIDNQSGQPDSNVYVMLTGGSSSDGQLSDGEIKALSDVTNQSFGVGDVTAGRLFFFLSDTAPDKQGSNDLPDGASSGSWAYNLRYDKIELTNPGSTNLTAVDFFSIPFMLQTLNSEGKVIDSFSFYANKNTIYDQLKAVAGGSVPGDLQRFLSPVKAAVADKISRFPYTSMGEYIKSVKRQAITISGAFYGTPFKTYSYEGTFAASDATLKLSGTISGVSAPKDLTIKGDSLADAIFSSNGPYYLGTDLSTAHDVSENDVYAAIYRDVIAGFNFGYVGGKWGSNSAAWWSHPPFAAARSNDGYFNHYAAIIRNCSDAYSFPFSDRQRKVLAGLDGTASTLQVTILADDFLEAPEITSVTATDDSITVEWDAITGATGYKARITPPLGGTTTDVGGETSHTFSSLAAGTPYSVFVCAYDATRTSPERRVTQTTDGTLEPVTGEGSWDLTLHMVGSIGAGQTLIFNGVSKDIPPGTDPTFNFVDADAPQCSQGENAYVLQWKDAQGNTLFETIFYVSITAITKREFVAGMKGTIDPSSSVTFLDQSKAAINVQSGDSWKADTSIQPIRKEFNDR